MVLALIVHLHYQDIKDIYLVDIDQSPSWLLVLVHDISLLGLLFQIKLIENSFR